VDGSGINLHPGEHGGVPATPCALDMDLQGPRRLRVPCQPPSISFSLVSSNLIKLRKSDVLIYYFDGPVLIVSD
jgi:hypothetical protein